MNRFSQNKRHSNCKKADGWHIIDFGRGLNYHHLTQNENDEKLNSNQLIGRFGVGLKDALATLYRHADMVGADFLLSGCEDADIEKAKKLFLKFSNEDILESNAFGDIIDVSDGGVSYIYINGVRVAEELNFLFSYNITSIL